MGVDAGARSYHDYTKEIFMMEYLKCMDHLGINRSLLAIKSYKLMVMRLLKIKHEYGDRAYFTEVNRLRREM